MPAARASAGEANCTVLPSSSIVPLSGVKTALMMRISVDLPAPLSPTRPVIGPEATSIETLSRATTPPNGLLTLQARRVGTRSPSAPGSGVVTADSMVFQIARATVVMARKAARDGSPGRARVGGSQTGHGNAGQVRPDRDGVQADFHHQINSSLDFVFATSRNAECLHPANGLGCGSLRGLLNTDDPEPQVIGHAGGGDGVVEPERSRTEEANAGKMGYRAPALSIVTLVCQEDDRAAESPLSSGCD